MTTGPYHAFAAPRLAAAEDLDVLASHDRHPGVTTLGTVIEAGRMLVTEGYGRILGWLRWGLFWDDVPFMNMLFVLESARGHGHGGALVEAWGRVCGPTGTTRC